MKKIIVFACLLTSIIAKPQVKNGVVTYQKQILQKTFTKELREEIDPVQFKKFKAIEDDMILALETIRFELKFNKTESFFQYVKALEHDNNNDYEMALIPNGSSNYYSNSLSKVSLEERNIFGEDFLITKNKLDWKLINESKQIGKYTCYKAEVIIKKMYRGKEKDYKKTAWYCPTINLSYGPMGYGGLPGLILELVDGKMLYKAKKIQLNIVDFKQIKALTNGKKVTENEMDDMISEAMGNFKKNKGY